MDNQVVIRQEGELAPVLVSTEQLLARKKAIHDIQEKVMRVDVDYGIIPGCGKKPTLYKAGAETLIVTFGLRPVINPATDIVVRELGGGHREYQITVHILNASGNEIATGVGSCSTMETKHRYRSAERICPECGKPMIIKGKEEYGGGWLCYAKKGGCGAKFKDGDKAIEDQEVGTKENENPADQYNTCLKVGKKRGLVDGVINATGVSHIFTQDIEDMKKEIIKDAEYGPVVTSEPETIQKVSDLQPEVENASTDKPEGKKEMVRTLSSGNSGVAPGNYPHSLKNPDGKPSPAQSKTICGFINKLPPDRQDKFIKKLTGTVKKAEDLTKQEAHDIISFLFDPANEEEIAELKKQE